ncbi:MAG: carboxymuconolactone decarboxylase family protein [Dehalococcoidia bacterium]|nr:carboxymuconolactone decarboxylase family protein [Dehalococcoidia bacterium]
MAWIRQESVEGDYSEMVKPLSINPRAMDAVFEMTQAISFGSSALTPVQEEAIAVAVSVSNRCRY